MRLSAGKKTTHCNSRAFFLNQFCPMSTGYGQKNCSVMLELVISNIKITLSRLNYTGYNDRICSLFFLLVKIDVRQGTVESLEISGAAPKLFDGVLDRSPELCLGAKDSTVVLIFNMHSVSEVKLLLPQNMTIGKLMQLQFVEHSNRRKMKSYSMRRRNSISAIIFIWLYFVAISKFVVWLGGFAPFSKDTILRHGHMARRSAPLRSCI